MLHVIVPHNLADSHPEDIEVPKHAASGTLSLVAVAVAVCGDPDGLEEGIDSASKQTQHGL